MKCPDIGVLKSHILFFIVTTHSPFSMQLGLYQAEYLQCCIYSEQAQESRRAERNRKAIVPLSIEC